MNLARRSAHARVRLPGGLSGAPGPSGASAAQVKAQVAGEVGQNQAIGEPPAAGGALERVVVAAAHDGLEREAGARLEDGEDGARSRAVGRLELHEQVRHLLPAAARWSPRRPRGERAWTHLLESRAGVTVKATFTIWIDGTFSNVPSLAGEAPAKGFGASTAEEALRAVIESRAETLLDAIESGRAAKAR
jgi:hypothetical protein